MKNVINLKYIKTYNNDNLNHWPSKNFLKKKFTFTDGKCDYVPYWNILLCLWLQIIFLWLEKIFLNSIY